MPHVLLICHVSSEIGMGHLSRLIALAETLRKDNKVIPEFVIFGDRIKKSDLAKFRVLFFSPVDDFVITLDNLLISNSYAAIVFDLYPKHNIDKLKKLLKNYRYS